MLSKLPKISKELLITSLVIFAALNFRAVFALTQTSHFVANHIIYLIIAFVPLTILIASKLSENFMKNFKAVDILALVVIMYALAVALHDTVIRYYLLSAIGVASVSLLLCRNIYTLPVAAILNLIAPVVPQLGASAAMSIPAAICFSTVYFSFIFEKKKSKKAEKNIPATDYEKRKNHFHNKRTHFVCSSRCYGLLQEKHRSAHIIQIQYTIYNPYSYPCDTLYCFCRSYIKEQKTFHRSYRLSCCCCNNASYAAV